VTAKAKKLGLNWVCFFDAGVANKGQIGFVLQIFLAPEGRSEQREAGKQMRTGLGQRISGSLAWDPRRGRAV
jgi:hypothetical protein